MRVEFASGDSTVSLESVDGLGFERVFSRGQAKSHTGRNRPSVIRATTVVPGGVKSAHDPLVEDRRCLERPLGSAEQVEVNVRVLGQTAIRRNVHPGDDVALLDPLSDLDQQESLVELRIAGINERFDAVVHHDRSTCRAGECQPDAIPCIGHTSIDTGDENFTEPERVIDAADDAVGHGIDGRKPFDLFVGVAVLGT